MPITFCILVVSQNHQEDVYQICMEHLSNHNLKHSMFEGSKIVELRGVYFQFINGLKNNPPGGEFDRLKYDVEIFTELRKNEFANEGLEIIESMCLHLLNKTEYNIGLIRLDSSYYFIRDNNILTIKHGHLLSGCIENNYRDKDNIVYID